MKKRFLSGLLVICMLIIMLPATALADGEGTAYQDEVLKYTLFDDSHARVDGLVNTNYGGAVDIPSELKVDEITYSVTEIKEGAFSGEYKNFSKITQVTLPDTITKIPASAFKYCDLTSINLGNITDIGADAFYFAKNLKEVDLSSAVTIGKGAFYSSTSLTKLELPKATLVENDAFGACNKLVSVNMPSIVTLGDEEAGEFNSPFRSCTRLTTVALGEHLGFIAPYAFSTWMNYDPVNVTIAAKNPTIYGTSFKDIDDLTITFTQAASGDVTWIGGEPTGVSIVYNDPPTPPTPPDPPIEEGDMENQDNDPAGVYLNGMLGDDSFDGSSADKAVKTLDKAVELAKENNSTIIISGQVTISDEQALANVDIQRRPVYRGYLFLITGENASFTLTDTRINGASNGDELSEKDWNSLIRAEKGANLTLGANAVLENNYSSASGGGISANEASITLKGGCIKNNSVHPIGGRGGGIYIQNGTLTIQDGSEVSGNRAGWGGGIAAVDSTVAMSGGEISGNRVSPTEKVPTFDKEDFSFYGGGICVSASGAGKTAEFTMSDGNISDNIASSFYNRISDTQGNGANPTSLGAGVALWDGSKNGSGTVTFTMSEGAKVTGNQGSSGGVTLLYPGSSFKMTGGEISGNTALGASSGTAGRGGGVYLHTGAKGKLSGGLISGNKASAEGGGGIYALGDDTKVTLSGTVEVSNNTASKGGGLCVEGYATANMLGGTIRNNTASYGGGVYIGYRVVDSRFGTMNLSGGNISGNTATGYLRNEGGDNTDYTFSQGIYVDGVLNLSGDAVIGADDDIAVCISPSYKNRPEYEGKNHYVNVVDAYTGADASSPIRITSCTDRSRSNEASYLIEQEDTALGTLLVKYSTGDDASASAAAASESGLFRPSKAMLAVNPKLAIRQSQVSDKGNILTYKEAEFVTLYPENQTIYTGGEDGDVANPEFPHPIYLIQDDDGNTSVLETDDVLVNGSAWDGDTQLPFTVKYYDSDNQEITSDRYYGDFTAKIVLADGVEAEDITVNGKSITLENGMLRIRYVSSFTEASNNALTTDALSYTDDSKTQMKNQAEDSGKPSVLLPEDTTIYLNGNKNYAYPAKTDCQIALLFDELLPVSSGGSNQDYIDALTAHAADKGFDLSEKESQFRYLDLVDVNDSNAWVSSSKGCDVFWPYPDGTDSSTEFQLLHFEGLHREYRMEGQDSLEEQIAASAVSSVEIETTDAGVWFHIPESGFSPFALIWSADEGGTEPEPSYIDVTVEKTWILDNGREMTPSVTVALIRDGSVYQTAVLDAKNNWTYTWRQLDSKENWTVEEIDVPDGFVSTVEQKGNTFLITNDDTAAPVPPSDPEQSDTPDPSETPGNSDNTGTP